MKEKTRKKLAALAILLASIITVYIVIALFPRTNNYDGKNTMMKEGDMPILIAHGGGNREFPDNTLEAFYNAYSVSADVMMETDVSITKDGVVILSHDTTLDRKTNVTGEIADWNYSDLMAEQVNFGYTNQTKDGKLVSGTEKVFFTNDEGVRVLPTNVDYPKGVEPRHSTVFLATTLEELIVAFPDNRINVEIKQSGELGKAAFAAVIKLLEKHDAFDRVVLASFHPEIYDEFKTWQSEGKVPAEFMYSPATNGATEFFILHLLGLDNLFGDRMCVFQLPMEELGFKLATKRLVENAHLHNLAVHFWTINGKDDMKYLIEIGADGIMTDYPHRLAEVYAEYKSSEN